MSPSSAPLPASSLLVFLALANASSAQSVLVVDAAGGPGSGFTTIGAAVAAAADGDFVLIRSGFYDETVHLDGLGLVLQAAAGAGVTVRGVDIENLPAGSFAALRGLRRASTFGDLTLTSNQGAVWIEDSPWSGSPIPFAPADVTDCASVVLRGAAFEACCLGRFGSVVIRGSSVALHECDVRGEDAGSSPFPVPGGAGLYVVDSRVTLYASRVEGGKGSDGVFGGSPGPGGPALVAGGATVVEVVGTTLVGGPGGTSGSVHGATGPKFQTLSGAIVLQRTNPAHLLATPSPATAGAATQATLTGKPGQLVYALVGNAPGPFMTASKWIGSLVVPMQSPLVFLGIVPGSGMLSASATPGLPPGSLVESFYLQPLFLGGGEIALGTPTQVHVLDPSL